jgi:hypothetical protein
MENKPALEKEESPVQFLKRRLEKYLDYNDPGITDLFDDALFKESEMVEMTYNQGRDDGWDDEHDAALDAGEVYYIQKYGTN